MSVLTSLTYDWRKARRSIIVGESMTVPDSVLTIHEIIARFTRGQSIPTRQGQNVEGDFSDYDNLTVFEQIDLARKTDKEIYDLRAKVMREYSDTKRTKDQKAIEKLIQDEVDKRTSPPVGGSTPKNS